MYPETKTCFFCQDSLRKLHLYMDVRKSNNTLKANRTCHSLQDPGSRMTCCAAPWSVMSLC